MIAAEELPGKIVDCGKWRWIQFAFAQTKNVHSVLQQRLNLFAVWFST